MLRNYKRVKLKLLILPITIIVGLITSIYFSYAYFLIGAEEENSVMVTAGEFNVLYNQGTYLSLASAEPIYDAYKYTKASYIPFVVTNTGAENSRRYGGASSACYSAYFDITRLDSDLQSKYLRWELYDVINDEIVSAGTFGGYQEDDSIFLTGSNTLAFGSSHSFKLYIWLSYSTTVNQIQMLGKTLNGNVRIESNSLSGCPIRVNVKSFDVSSVTVVNGIQDVSSGSDVTVKYYTGESPATSSSSSASYEVVNLCEMVPTVVQENGNYYGAIKFENIQIGHNCTLMTTSDEYPFIVWAVNLKYNNANTGLKDVRTNDDCEDSQCAIDAIAGMIHDADT